MTRKKTGSPKKFLVLTPLFGAVLFIVIYLAAAFLYPGGSQADKFSKGFSWINNYWCNLLNEQSINGQYNPARPVAVTGMLILCVSMAVFWYQFARIIKFDRPARLMVQVSGIISMCAAFFLVTSYHDIIINIAGLLSVCAFTGTLTGLFKSGWKKLFWLGIFNVILIGVNNFIYYTHYSLNWLPVVQKITFLFFLVWVCLIDFNLYKRVSSKQEASQ